LYAHLEVVRITAWATPVSSTQTPPKNAQAFRIEFDIYTFAC